MPLITEGTRDELNRDDSPSTDKDKDAETDSFGGSGDISLSGGMYTSDFNFSYCCLVSCDLNSQCFKAGSGSKPVSIPSAPGFSYRERFPSGSSPMASSLNSYKPLGSNMFAKNEADPVSSCLYHAYHAIDFG